MIVFPTNIEHFRNLIDVELNIYKYIKVYLSVNYSKFTIFSIDFKLLII